MMTCSALMMTSMAPMSMEGLYVGACLPRTYVAASVASRPSFCPAPQHHIKESEPTMLPGMPKGDVMHTVSMSQHALLNMFHPAAGWEDPPTCQTTQPTSNSHRYSHTASSRMHRHLISHGPPPDLACFPVGTARSEHIATCEPVSSCVD